ncbi:hypothetical protein [Heyndrickxia acidiproducens]|uniref:hypothetical protein n=1 Tax=Heyndrickxia acidiproducens TaxID=1121084 RepID=UPI0003785B71|nr:hypothetical protein [Heyndrickxia acidiproducens]
MHFVRLLNTKNVEFYEVYREYCGESLGYLLIIDTRRPGRLSDNPVIDEIEKEFVGASNFIKVNIITKKELPQQFLEEIQLFVSGLIEEKPDSGFFIHTFVSKKELRYDLPSDMVSIAEFVKPYLKGVNDDVSFAKLTNEKFNYLSQD